MKPTENNESDEQQTGAKNPLARLVMTNLESVEIEWAVMEPDVYGGENLDKHVPQWRGCASGDMECETFREPMMLDPKFYPPGTKVSIRVPICPKCGDVYENCIVRGNVGDCDFDWNKLVENTYS